MFLYYSTFYIADFKMNNLIIPLGKLIKINDNEYLLQTNFFDSYDDCIDLILTVIDNKVQISDDGSFDSFYHLTESKKYRIDNIRKSLGISKDENNGLFYKQVNKKDKKVIYSNIIIFIQFLIKIDVIAIDIK